MTWGQFIAILEEQTSLLTYGPLGVIACFFMGISVKLLSLGSDLVKAIKEDNEKLRRSIDRLAHRTDGLQRALLADMVERESIGIATKNYCRRTLAEIDARANQNGSNPPM